MAVTTLAMAELDIDDDIQQRADGLSIATVNEYAEAYDNGAELPPIVAFESGDGVFVADGFHRYHARLSLGLDDIEVDLRKGSREDAILYACSANTTHGLRRTNADKRKAVKTLLAKFAKRSDRWIAEKAAVSHPIVADARRQVENFTTCQTGGTPKQPSLAIDEDDDSEPEQRIGSDGKAYPSKRKPKPVERYPAVELYQQLMLSIGALHDELLQRYNHSIDEMVTSPDWNMDWTGVAMNYASESAKLCSRFKKELSKYV